jgi:hypothetical protein
MNTNTKKPSPNKTLTPTNQTTNTQHINPTTLTQQLTELKNIWTKPNPNNIEPHNNNCWRWHHQCAIQRLIATIEHLTTPPPTKQPKPKQPKHTTPNTKTTNKTQTPKPKTPKPKTQKSKIQNAK